METDSPVASFVSVPWNGRWKVTRIGLPSLSKKVAIVTRPSNTSRKGKSHEVLSTCSMWRSSITTFSGGTAAADGARASEQSAASKAQAKVHELAVAPDHPPLVPCEY